jgi:hypothetical protein
MLAQLTAFLIAKGYAATAGMVEASHPGLVVGGDECCKRPASGLPRGGISLLQDCASAPHSHRIHLQQPLTPSSYCFPLRSRCNGKANAILARLAKHANRHRLQGVSGGASRGTTTNLLAIQRRLSGCRTKRNPCVKTVGRRLKKPRWGVANVPKATDILPVTLNLMPRKCFFGASLGELRSGVEGPPSRYGDSALTDLLQHGLYWTIATDQ